MAFLLSLQTADGLRRYDALLTAFEQMCMLLLPVAASARSCFFLLCWLASMLSEPMIGIKRRASMLLYCTPKLMHYNFQNRQQLFASVGAQLVSRPPVMHFGAYPTDGILSLAQRVDWPAQIQGLGSFDHRVPKTGSPQRKTCHLLQHAASTHTSS